MADSREKDGRTLEEYGLRSLFFYKHLEAGRFDDLFAQVTGLDCSQYDFGDLESISISLPAIELVEARGIPLCHVFCHPDLIKEQPTLIRYYRGIAAISQKGLNRLAHTSRVAAWEAGIAKRAIPDDAAKRLARNINTLISAAVVEVESLEMQTLQYQVLATAGAQIDGSWRQEPGKVASEAVKALMILELSANGFVGGAPSKDEIASTSRFKLTNDYTVTFSSEPDVSIADSAGKEVAVIEIKGGIDPAGALERYGAAKKSFEDALNRNPSVITVYLAAVITPTVKQRIETDRTVRETYNLSDVLSLDAEKEKFLNQMYWWLHLQRRSSSP